MRRINHYEAEHLRRHITDSGLSVTTLAKQSGVPQPVLTRFINRQRGLLYDTAQKVLDALNIVIDDRENLSSKETSTLMVACERDCEKSARTAAKCEAELRRQGKNKVADWFAKIGADFATVAAKFKALRELRLKTVDDGCRR